MDVEEAVNDCEDYCEGAETSSPEAPAGVHLGRRGRGSNLALLLETLEMEMDEDAFERGKRQGRHMKKKDLIQCIFVRLDRSKSQQCTLCAKTYPWNATDWSTKQSTLRRHLESEHRLEWDTMFHMLERSKSIVTFSGRTAIWNDLREYRDEIVSHALEKRKRASLDRIIVRTPRRSNARLARDIHVVIALMMRGIPFTNLSDPFFLSMVSRLARCGCDGTNSCALCVILSPSSVHDHISMVESATFCALKQDLIVRSLFERCSALLIF